MRFECEISAAPELEVARVHDERSIDRQTELLSQLFGALG
jgi:hypothetical protein